MKIALGTVLITTILITNAGIALADDSVPVLALPAAPDGVSANVPPSPMPAAQSPKSVQPENSGPPSSMVLQNSDANSPATPGTDNTSNAQNTTVPTASSPVPLPPLGNEPTGNVSAIIGNTDSSKPSAAPPANGNGAPKLPTDNASSQLPLPSPDKPAEQPVPEKAATAASTDESAKVDEAAEKKKGKHKKKHVKLAEKPQLPIHYDIKDRLSDEIYKKSYDRRNRHLPVAYYESDYDNLVFITAERDDLNGLRSLIAAGRNINMVNAAGETPLIVAVRNGSINTALLLVRHNAEVNVTDGRGLTPLEIASANGDQRMVNILSGIE